MVVGDEAAALRRRRAAAQRWCPSTVELLLVAEAPPSALDRYFYFDDVRTHDSLFRHVVEGVLGERPTRDKAPYLDELRERGVFLIDLSEEPFSGRHVLTGCVPGLVRRATRLTPARVVLVGVSAYDAAFGPARAAGLPAVDARLPYPGSGQQRRFLEGFRRAIREPTALPARQETGAAASK